MNKFLNHISHQKIGYYGSIGSFSGIATNFFRNHILDVIYTEELRKDESSLWIINTLLRILTKIKKPKMIAVPSLDELINRVKRGEFDYGVVPYSTTKFGELKEITSKLTTKDGDKNKIKICGNISMQTNISLYRKNKDIDAPEINTIISDKYCIKQCESIIKRLYKNKNKNFQVIEENEDASTIAKLMSKGFYSDKTAVLCSSRAGKFYNLNQIITNMQDDKSNHTSFVMFGNNI